MPKGKIVTFFSTKGGVGKTTILVNTAVVLARHLEKKVAILDCNLQFGIVAIMFDLFPPDRTITHLVEEPRPWTPEIMRDYIIRHESSGVDLLCSPSQAEHAEIVQIKHIKRVLELMRELYDVVLVDTPPRLGDIEHSILPASDLIVMPVTTNTAAVANARLALDWLHDLHIVSPGRIVVIINHIQDYDGVPDVHNLQTLLGVAETMEESIAAYRMLRGEGLDADPAMCIAAQNRLDSILPRGIPVHIPHAPRQLTRAECVGTPFMSADPKNATTQLGRAFVNLAQRITQPTLQALPPPSADPESLPERMGLFRRMKKVADWLKKTIK